ncbi:hypothetical protein Cgig2_016051 [Carnegiea gigantea]|uniref:Uncharacterized protein n=1 Tax=Carnegiea gigantea TaxID=171969 RepID=A0A9Q1Q8S9_9CARY|nr:hypothetical protein Cgig2_016051 [Carnegiea gigantea]
MSLSLWDLYKLGGPPINGKIYDEAVPNRDALYRHHHDNQRLIQPACRYLFTAYSRLENARNRGVCTERWIDFWCKRQVKHGSFPRRRSSSKSRPISTHYVLDPAPVGPLMVHDSGFGGVKSFKDALRRIHEETIADLVHSDVVEPFAISYKFMTKKDQDWWSKVTISDLKANSAGHDPSESKKNRRGNTSKDGFDFEDQDSDDSLYFLNFGLWNPMTLETITFPLLEDLLDLDDDVRSLPSHQARPPPHQARSPPLNSTLSTMATAELEVLGVGVLAQGVVEVKRSAKVCQARGKYAEVTCKKCV